MTGKVADYAIFGRRKRDASKSFSSIFFFALLVGNCCVYLGIHISLWLKAMSARDLIPLEQRIEMNSNERWKVYEGEKTISSNGRFSESTNTNHGSGKIRVDFIRTLTAYRIHKPFSNQKEVARCLRIRRKKKRRCETDIMNVNINKTRRNGFVASTMMIMA